jgi:glucoamylase
MLFANQFLATGGDPNYVTSSLYNSTDPNTGIQFPSTGVTNDIVIKADLDFVANNWNASGFDLWEEVYGQHFYTRLVLARWVC